MLHFYSNILWAEANYVDLSYLQPAKPARMWQDPVHMVSWVLSVAIIMLITTFSNRASTIYSKIYRKPPNSNALSMFLVHCPLFFEHEQPRLPDRLKQMGHVRDCKSIFVSCPKATLRSRARWKFPRSLPQSTWTRICSVELRTLWIPLCCVRFLVCLHPTRFCAGLDGSRWIQHLKT